MFEDFDEAAPLRHKIGELASRAFQFREELNFEDAASELKKAISLYSELGIPEPDSFPDLSNMWGMLGAILDELHELSEATGAHEKSISMLRRLVEIDPWASQDLAMRLVNYGNTLDSLDRTDDAAAAYIEAIAIRRDLVRNLGDSFKSKLANVLGIYAGLLRRQNEQAKAKSVLEEAVELFAGELLDESERALLASTKACFADVEADLGDLAASRRHLLEVLEIRSSLGNKPGQAEALKMLGGIDERLSDARSAVEWTERASVLFRELVPISKGAYLPELASCLNNLGNMRGALQWFDEADEAYDECLQIRRELSNASKRVHGNKLASTLSNYGVFKKDRGELQEAAELLEEASEWFSPSNSGVEANDWARIKHNLGTVYCELSHFEKGRVALTEAERVRSELYETTPSAYAHRYALTLECLALAFEVVGDLDSSKTTLLKAIVIYESQFATNIDNARMYLAIGLSNLGNVCSKLNELHEALAAYQHSVEIFKDLYESDKQRYVREYAISLQNLGSLLAELGDSQASMRMLELSLKLKKLLPIESDRRLQTERASTKYCMGKLARLSGDIELALKHLGSAALDHKNLSGEDQDSFLDDRIHCFQEFGFALFAAFEVSEDITQLLAAAEILEQCIESTDSFRLRFLDPVARRKLTEQVLLPTSRRLIDCFALLREKTGDAKWANKAVATSERCRARAFRDLRDGRRMPLGTPAGVIEKFKVDRDRVQGLAQMLHEMQCRRANELPTQLPHVSESAMEELEGIDADGSESKLKSRYYLAAEEYQRTVESIRKKHDPSFYPEGRSAEPTLEEVRSTLKSMRREVVQITTTDRSVYAAIISEDEICFLDLCTTESRLAERRTAWFELLETEENAAALDELGQQVDLFLHDLSESLVQPIIEALHPSTEALTFVHGAYTSSLPLSLCELPFGDRVADRYDVSVSPFLAGVIGDEFNHSPRVKSTLVREANTDLQSVARELKSVTSQLPTAKVMELQQFAAIQQALPESDVFHYCGHAFFSRSDPLESALGPESAEHVMSVRDISTKLQCSTNCLVFLNACQTSSFLPDPLDEYIGLVPAFTSIGASFVIGTLWEAEDLPAWLFTDRYYKNLARGLGCRDSFFQTQRWLRGVSDDRGESLSDKSALESYVKQLRRSGQLDQNELDACLEDAGWWTTEENMPPFRNPAHWGCHVLTECHA